MTLLSHCTAPAMSRDIKPTRILTPLRFPERRDSSEIRKRMLRTPLALSTTSNYFSTKKQGERDCFTSLMGRFSLSRTSRLSFGGLRGFFGTRRLNARCVSEQAVDFLTLSSSKLEVMLGQRLLKLLESELR